MPLDKQLVRDTLLSKFKFEEVEGTKHGRIAFFYNNKKIATTGFSRGSRKDLDDSLLGIMAKEILVLKLGFFKGMITCSNSRLDYLKVLNDGGFIKNIPE
ncbi:hypothetical protein IMZ68_04680 [Candidatus Bathyarchaeota archaeon]|nr:hypothetical protein [Candidatus Bathyarchaeota archaeon]